MSWHEGFPAAPLLSLPVRWLRFGCLGAKPLIELVPTTDDDPSFLALVQKIVTGALASFELREAFLVHIDNWFDHKWLGWWSSWEHKDIKVLYVPPFNPNRVVSQKHFICEGDSSQWAFAGEGKPLHRRLPGRRGASGQKLDQFSSSAAFVWYSGNTGINGAGSMMFYVSGSESYAWYASFRRDLDWAIADGFRISPRELLSFEKRGSPLSQVGA